MNKTLSLECSSAQRLFSVAELISGMGSMCVASAVHILIVVIKGTGGELVSYLKSCQLLILYQTFQCFICVTQLENVPCFQVTRVYISASCVWIVHDSSLVHVPSPETSYDSCKVFNYTVSVYYRNCRV